MALDFENDPLYAGRITPASASYPQGSSKNETNPGVSDDGMQHIIGRSNDVFGLHQGLLRLASITPSGIPDTAILSEYIKALTELSSGRAMFYTGNTGTASAHELTLKPNQHGPQAYFDGMECQYFVSATNLGAVTVDVNSFGAVDLWSNGAPLIGNELRNGSLIRIRHLLASNRFELMSTANNRAGTRLVMFPDSIEVGNGFSVNSWVSLAPSELSAAAATAALILVSGSTATASTLLAITNITSAHARRAGSVAAADNSTQIDGDRIDKPATGFAQIANTSAAGMITVPLGLLSNFEVYINSFGGNATLRTVHLLGYYI